SLPGNGLNIGDVSRFRVSHDRSRIAVDKNCAIAFGFQRFASLGAGVVELARLPNDNRACTNNKNVFDICTLWHDAELVPCSHKANEFVEEHHNIVWPRAGFGMPLEAERRGVGKLETLQCAVE